MNLVEFPDDKIAFEPNSVKSIQGKTPEFPTLSCPTTCPERSRDEYTYIPTCGISSHVSYPEYTIVSVYGKDMVIHRPFSEVMLVISAHLLDNEQTKA